MLGARKFECLKTNDLQNIELLAIRSDVLVKHKDGLCKRSATEDLI